LLTRYVQTPAEAGYGFGLSGVLAGAALIPFSVLGFIGGRFTHWLTTRLSARWTFVIYAGCVVLAAILFAMVRGSLIATLTSMAILGFGVGGASAIMPQLVLNGVPQQETSSVLSINQIVRTMGFSIGSALASLVLATATETGNVLSTASGYAIAAFCVLSLLVLSALAIIPGRPRATRIDKIADQHR
jgi:predicted MFS family arabinose efflux permease